MHDHKANLSLMMGASVVCAMFIGSILGAVVAHSVWHWPCCWPR